MAWDIGELNNNNGVDCRAKLLTIIRNIAVANGWVIMRDQIGNLESELILRGVGLDQNSEFYIGLKNQHNVQSDTYAYQLMVATGYVENELFEKQPGQKIVYVPANNVVMNYFITINADRLVFVLKPTSGVYEHGYVGKFNAYAKPHEYPLPLCVVGQSASFVRYSDTNQFAGYLGTSTAVTSQMWVRLNSGLYSQPENANMSLPLQTSSCNITPSTKFEYLTLPSSIYHTEYGPIGELIGVSNTTGFQATSEDIIQHGGTFQNTTNSTKKDIENILKVGGVPHIIFQDTHRTDIHRFLALRID